MRSRLLLALLGIAGLVLVAGLWFALRVPDLPAPAPRPVGGTEVASRDTSADLRAPAPSPSARGNAGEAAAPAPEVGAPESGAGLHVLSSSALALPHVDWRAVGGEWRRVELADGGVPRSSIPAPCEVRALGHLAAALEPGLSELVLEPDVLFTLHAPDLRDCVREIDVNDPYLSHSMRGTDLDRRRPNLGLWGYVSDTEWVAAVSAESVLREFGDRELRVVLHRRDGRRTDVVLNTTSDLRETWPVPCDDIVPTAPLRVTVVRPEGHASAAVDVHVGRSGTSYEDAQRESHAWGFVIHYPVGAWGPKRVLAEGEDELEFEALPLNLPHGVVAQDPTSKAYGFVQFVHDGSPRSLSMRPPLRVTGRLLDARDDTAIGRASLVWQCMSDGERVTGWRAEAFDAVLAGNGAFDLAGPMTPPAPPSRPLEPPGTLSVRIEAPGFEPLELEREIGAARVIDLGDLRLEARAPELVLARGHGLTPELVAWQSFEIAGQPGLWWEVRWGRLVDDGSLELHFGEEELEREQKPGTDAKPALDWSTARALILYTNDDEAPVRAFERDAEGRYAAVELRRHALEFQVEPSASERNWWIGWEWNGLFGKCEGFTRPAAGETLRVELSAPVDGARLAWASREPGGRGRLVPDELASLVDPLPVLVLR